MSAVDRVNFKVAALVYRCLLDVHRVAEMDSRRQLRSSADTNIRLVPRFRLVTVSDHSFLVAGT